VSRRYTAWLRHPVLVTVLAASAVLLWHLRADAPGVPTPPGPGVVPPDQLPSPAGVLLPFDEQSPAQRVAPMAGLQRLSPGATVGSWSHPGVMLTLQSLEPTASGRVRLSLLFGNRSPQAVELVLDHGWTILRDAGGGPCRMTADSARTPAGGEFRTFLFAGDRRALWIECEPFDPRARLFVFSPGPVSPASNRVRFDEFEVALPAPR